MTLKIIASSKDMLKMIIHYSGIEYIYRKFVPPKNSETLPTGFIWLVTIYIALFGIAFNRYESRTHEINNLANNFQAQLRSEKNLHLLSQIPSIQWQPCPLKPIIFNPISVYLSMFGEDRQYEEIADSLKNIIISYRNNLNSLYLGYCDLRGVVFLGGKFEKSELIYSKLEQSVFLGVNFNKTHFFNAKFNKSIFTNCSFVGANLRSVNFKDARFNNCDLEAAEGLELEQLLKCKFLYQCKLKSEWLQIIKRDYPNKLKYNPLWSSDGADLNIYHRRNLPPYMEKIFKEHVSENNLR